LFTRIEGWGDGRRRTKSWLSKRYRKRRTACKCAAFCFYANVKHWAFCQLELLRQCFPPSVRRILEELPDSLDETYERILREIRKPNQGYAHRLLQCWRRLFARLRSSNSQKCLHLTSIRKECRSPIQAGVGKMKKKR
jgi:hypothetical protein